MTPDEIPQIHFEVERPSLSVAMIILDELKVGESSPSFEEYEKETFKEIQSQLTLEEVKDDPLFRSYRDLYWTFGLDPTKFRVSSEAVIRRILKGLNLWRLSDIVDIVNLASAYHKIPIGLIDASKLKGNLVVRTAFNGELFQRIGGKIIMCRGREIVVADEQKIVCFGYATHDSERTMITKDSSRVLVLLYGSEAVTSDVMDESLKITLDMIDQWLDCKVSEPIIYLS
ncbi:MAG: B3/B4 domain-containing protein [Candidatus Thorarchaeota archaeon]|jgi:DNA/RNA-binding domain of Phe-tRNA-synthetase-like protein